MRLSYGEAYFWQNGYTLFFDMAQNLHDGKGLCQEYFGVKYAYRPPVYPLFLWAATWFGKSFWPIIILQSLVGTATTYFAYHLGKLLFDRLTGMLTGAMVAIYPYFISHDTALQETAFFTCLTALSVYFLYLARNNEGPIYWIGAGIAIGLALLTRTTLIAWVCWVPLWVLFFSALPRREGWRNMMLMACAFACLLIPWLIRNYRLIGRPALTTLSGLTLWAGNNAYTFSDYPQASIDRSVARAYRELSPEQYAVITSLSQNEIEQSNYFTNLAWDYMRANPELTFKRAFLKVGAAFSWRQNPARPGMVQIVYFCSYLPVLVLGCCGIYLSRKRWRELSLIYALFVTFILVTAVFFAHTSHRVYLDVYLMVFAAYALKTAWQKWQPQSRLAGLS